LWECPKDVSGNCTNIIVVPRQMLSMNPSGKKIVKKNFSKRRLDVLTSRNQKIKVTNRL
jgi:hypothetical protein